MRLSKLFVESLEEHRKDFYDKAYADECGRTKAPVMKVLLADVDAIIELAKCDEVDGSVLHCYSDHPCDVCGKKMTRKWFDRMLCETHIGIGDSILPGATPCKGGWCEFHHRHLTCMECSGGAIRATFEAMVVKSKKLKDQRRKTNKKIKNALRRM